MIRDFIKDFIEDFAVALLGVACLVLIIGGGVVAAILTGVLLMIMFPALGVTMASALACLVGAITMLAIVSFIKTALDYLEARC